MRIPACDVAAMPTSAMPQVWETLKSSVGTASCGRPRRPRTSATVGRRDAERLRQQPAQRGAPDDPAPAQRLGPEALRAGDFLVGKRARERRGFVRRPVERKPPQLDRPATGGSEIAVPAAGGLSSLPGGGKSSTLTPFSLICRRAKALRRTASIPCNFCSSSSPASRCRFSTN